MNVKYALAACVWLAALSLQAQTNATVNAPASTNGIVVANPPADSHLEQVRTACIAGRRHICGRVLQISKAGLVVDSGYIGLLEPPFNHNWVTRANVELTRPSPQVEGNAPDAVAVGLVILTDFPKRPAVQRYDYVSLIGYPCGQADYVPVEGITKNLRRFSGGLETAVNLNLKAEKH